MDAGWSWADSLGSSESPHAQPEALLRFFFFSSLHPASISQPGTISGVLAAKAPSFSIARRDITRIRLYRLLYIEKSSSRGKASAWIKKALGRKKKLYSWQKVLSLSEPLSFRGILRLSSHDRGNGVAVHELGLTI